MPLRVYSEAKVATLSRMAFFLQLMSQAPSRLLQTLSEFRQRLPLFYTPCHFLELAFDHYFESYPCRQGIAQEIKKISLYNAAHSTIDRSLKLLLRRKRQPNQHTVKPPQVSPETSASKQRVWRSFRKWHYSILH